MLIDVQGDVIRVNLNGTDTAKYTNAEPGRGQFSATDPTFCWVTIIFELQLHDSVSQCADHCALNLNVQVERCPF